MSDLYTDYFKSSVPDINKDLRHYGVLGMKWGVRKADEFSEHARNYKTRAVNEKLKSLKKEKVISGSEYRMAKKRHKLNSKEQKVNNKQYIKDLLDKETDKVKNKETIGKVATEIFNTRLSEIEKDMPDFGNFIKKQYSISPSFMYYDAILNKYIEPSTYSMLLSNRYVNKYKNTQEFNSYLNELLAHYDIDPSYLQHHGIEGQKWGVKRGPPYPIGSGSKSGSSSNQKSSKKTGLKEDRDAHKKYAPGDAMWVYQTPFTRDIDKYGAEARKEYLEHRSQTNEIDAKTGFYKKSKSFTREEDRDIINIEKESLASGPRSNCVLCSVAYDARRRGQEVIANYAVEGYTDEEMASAYKGPDDLFLGRDDHPWHMAVLPTTESRKAYTDSVRSQINKLPNNSRGVMTVSWGHTIENLFGGHALAWEVSDKIFRIYDCQSGKTYTDRVDAITGNTVKPLQELLDTTALACISRTDNLELNYDFLKKDGWLV